MNRYDYGELIVCAAIKRVNGEIVCGVRHADCGIDATCTHGFMTNKSRFVDRKEAFKIANRASQIKYYPKNVLEWHLKNKTYPSLFSENLY